MPWIPILLVVIAVCAFLPPLLRLRISRLRFGSTSVELSRPLDFRRAGPAVASVAIGIACLAAAAVLAGLAPELPSRHGVAIATSVPPQELDYVDEDKETGRVTISLKQPDTMAGWRVADQIGDFEAAALADSIVGPLNAVACLTFRASGEEIRDGETYHAAGTRDWPASGYMFCVSHVGQWALSRFDQGFPTYLENYQDAKTIRQTKANKIGVRAEGATFVLSINNMEVARVNDAGYASGSTYLTCGTPADAIPAATCHFEDLEVTALP
jgi:hypothetical protein